MFFSSNKRIKHADFFDFYKCLYYNTVKIYINNQTQQVQHSSTIYVMCQNGGSPANSGPPCHFMWSSDQSLCKFVFKNLSFHPSRGIIEPVNKCKSLSLSEFYKNFLLPVSPGRPTCCWTGALRRFPRWGR